MNRRSFFQRIACAVVGVTAAVYAPGLLKDAAASQWPTWKNYTMRHTNVTAADLIEKMRTAHRKVTWRYRPAEHREGVLKWLE